MQQAQLPNPTPHHDDPHDDDRPIGRVLSRREALALLGAAAGGALLAACRPAALPPTAEATAATLPAAATDAPATSAVPTPTAEAAAAAEQAAAMPLPACVVRPEQTAGPFFVDEQLNRSDVRAEPATGAVAEGAPFELTFRVAQVSAAGCAALAGMVVDIWHCDAHGVYSGVGNAAGQSFLRGYQVTDEAGVARFTTIYPGWYPGRTPHIHFKLRAPAAEGRAYDFTSQLYFDEAVTDQVYAQPPYAGRGPRNTTNATDGVFRNGGEQLMLAPAAAGEGYAATFEIGVDLSG